MIDYDSGYYRNPAHLAAMASTTSIPVVLVFAGTDPSGGAGLQADVEALASHGCHPAPVVTAVTVQDTRDIYRVQPMDPQLVIDQALRILEDMPIRAIKIGLIGSADTARALGKLLDGWPDLPVVLDPVLRAGGGTALIDANGLAALKTLLPTVTVLTPNSQEARALVPEHKELDACGLRLLESGCEFALITGAHEPETSVVNRLYGNGALLECFSWKRLAGSFHGSGCTLASSIAGLLAQGTEPFSAIHQAQEYTWQTLNHGYRAGRGQNLPNRLFWAQRDEQ